MHLSQLIGTSNPMARGGGEGGEGPEEEGGEGRGQKRREGKGGARRGRRGREGPEEEGGEGRGKEEEEWLLLADVMLSTNSLTGTISPACGVVWRRSSLTCR